MLITKKIGLFCIIVTLNSISIANGQTGCLELKDLLPKSEVTYSIPFNGGKLSYLVEPEKLGTWSVKSLIVMNGKKIPGSGSSYEFTDLGSGKQKYIIQTINGNSELKLKTNSDGTLKGSTWIGKLIGEEITIIDNCLNFDLKGKKYRGIMIKTAYPKTGVRGAYVDYAIYVEGAGGDWLANGEGKLEEILRKVTDFKIK